MNPKPLLEIVIPTYNRADILCCTLKEITAAIGVIEEHVSLRIIDNCSTDHTFEVVRPYLEAKQLSYERNSCNIGLIKNIAKCIDSSRAYWVWVFGDDDHIISHSLPFLIKSLKELSSDVVFARALSLKISEDGLLVGIEFPNQKVGNVINIHNPGVAIACNGSVHSLAFISQLIINPLHWDQAYHDSIYTESNLYTFVLALLVASIDHKAVDLHLHVVAATDRGDRSYYTPNMCVARLTEFTDYECLVHEAFNARKARKILSRGRKGLLKLRLISCIKLAGHRSMYSLKGSDPISYMSKYRSPYMLDVIAIRIVAAFARFPLAQRACKKVYDHFYAKLA